MNSFNIKSGSHEELIDITLSVQEVITAVDIRDGICCVYTPHTTAAITINENADPSVQRDIIKGLRHLDLESPAYAHGEGNSPSHIKSSMFGCSELVIIENGRLQLGTWQGIYFCEFDGPRNRKVWVKVL